MRSVLERRRRELDALLATAGGKPELRERGD